MRIPGRALIIVCIVLSSALTGAGLGAKTGGLQPAVTPPSGQWFDYVLNIMLENHSINFTYYNGGPVNSCIGNCTYFTSFANANGLAEGLTDGHINASTASYIAITSGFGNSAQACNNGPNAAGCPYLQIRNIVDSLENAGLTWKAYFEGYAQPQTGCFTNFNNAAPFYYTANHNPFLYYADIVNNTSRCSRIVTANSVPITQSSTGCWPSTVQNDDVLIKDLNSVTSASNYMWLTPNTVDQSHDCNDVSVANAWLNSIVPQILGSTLFKTKRSALFITFDEPGCTNPLGQTPCPTGASSNVYAVWASNPSNPTTRNGFKSTQSYLLYSPLKAAEANWGLPTLTANDASANNMAEFFAILSATFTISPGSIQPGTQVTFTASATGGSFPYSYNWKFGDGGSATTGTATHAYTVAGTYAAKLSVTDKVGTTKNVTKTIIVGPDFIISSNPPSLIFQPGATNTSTISLSSVNGFSGNVSLTTSVSPTGLMASPNPSSLNLAAGTNASSTLTLSSATLATYTVNVTGASGAHVHTVSLTARVANPDFSISGTPASLTIPPATPRAATIKLSSFNQFSGTVSLSASVSPLGLTSSLSALNITLSPGGSLTTTLTVSSLNYGNYTLTVTGTSGALSHSATVSVRVFPTSVIVQPDSASGTTSLYTPGGQKLIQDSFGKMIAVYVDNSGRISLTYDNADPSQGAWSTPVKSPTPTIAYSWPAAVLVSLTSLHVITVGGSATGVVVDIPVTVSRGSGNNITGFSFGTPTTLDASGLGRFVGAILLHNNDILAGWGWENTTASILKSSRWDSTTGWTNLAGSLTSPDNVIVDKSIIQYFVPSLIERRDNHNIYLFAGRFVNSSRIGFIKASWNGSGWSWGTPTLTYETNASDSDDDAIGVGWDPGRSLVVVEYGITGTHTYGVFTLNATDVKIHMDTPILAVTGDRGWGQIGVQANTGDYYLFLVSVGSDAGSGSLGYIRAPSGGSWNATITWLNVAADNQATSLRTTGPNPSLDLLYVEGTTPPGNLKLLRLGAPSFNITTTPANQSVHVGSAGSETITVSSLYNYAGTITLSDTVPTGLNCVPISPMSLTSFGTASISCVSAYVGNYTVQIIGTAGPITKAVPLIFRITDFGLSSPTSVTSVVGSNPIFTITVTGINGYSGTVRATSQIQNPATIGGLVGSGAGGGRVVFLSSIAVEPSLMINPTSQVIGTNGTGQFKVMIVVPAGVLARNYTILFMASDGPLSHMIQVMAIVTDFSVSSPTNLVSVSPGNNATMVLSVQSLNGFQGNIAIFSSINPAGPTVTSSPSSLSLFSQANIMLTINVPSGVQVGNYTLTVQAASGALSHTVNIVVQVSATAASAPTVVAPDRAAATEAAGLIVLIFLLPYSIRDRLDANRKRSKRPAKGMTLQITTFRVDRSREILIGSLGTLPVSLTT